jgi:hypothetical protein
VTEGLERKVLKVKGLRPMRFESKVTVYRGSFRCETSDKKMRKSIVVGK